MLTTVQRMKLGDLLVALRPDWSQERWHRMSVDKALLELATDPRHPGVLMVQAIDNARNAANLTPDCVTRQTIAISVIEKPSATHAASTISCGVCRYIGPVRVDGECPSCWHARQPVRPAGLRIGTSSGPSAEARALIAASIGPRAARQLERDLTRHPVAANVRPPTDQKENQQ